MTNIPGFRTGIDLSFDYWLAIWTVGSALAFVAVARGSRRWAWAGLLSPSIPYNERMKPKATINSPILAVWSDEHLLKKC